MSLIYLDIDYFKTINDQYGHHEGDIVLKEIGTRLIKTQEALIILGGLAVRNSLSFYQIVQLKKHGRLQNNLRKNSRSADLFKSGMSIHTTVSIGCAYSYGTSADIKQLPIIADQELYKAKESGRNQVSFSEKKDHLT